MASKSFLKFDVIIFLSSILIFLMSFLLGCSKKNEVAIGITQIVSHPSLDEIRKGIIDSLQEKGFKDGENIKILFRNANGDPSLTLPIAQDFVRQKVSVLVPITTPSALGAAKSTQNIPIVFGAVTDPVGTGLVENLQNPQGNITGTSDRWPIDKQVELIFNLLPQIKSIGMIYRPGDDVSKIGIEEMKSLSEKYHFQLELLPCSDAGQIYLSAVNLMRKVDVVYTGMDNLVAENLEAVLKASVEMKKPVFSGDQESVERGALATVALKMYDIGKMTGDMVAEVLNGKNPGDMPVRTITSGIAVANLQTAESFGITSLQLKELGISLVSSDNKNK